MTIAAIQPSGWNVVSFVRIKLSIFAPSSRVWSVSTTGPFGKVMSTGNSRHVQFGDWPRCQSVRGIKSGPRVPDCKNAPTLSDTRNESSSGVGASTRPQRRYVPASFTSSCHETLPGTIPRLPISPGVHTYAPPLAELSFSTRIFRATTPFSASQRTGRILRT